MVDTPVSNSPNVLSPFFGRQREREQVIELLVQDDSRLVTIHGPGGIGKTRLAVAVAHDLTTRHHIDVVFVDLAAAFDARRMLTDLAAALEIQVDAETPLDQQVGRALADRLPLLVLDNIEQVSGASQVISGLLRATPGLTLLATSRRLFRIQGERRFALPPLLVALDIRDTSGDDLLAHPAIQLFADRARAIQPDFTVSASNVEAIRDICVRVDGLPLAIELAAARASIFSPSQLLQKLAHSFSLLSMGDVDAPARHQTMRHAIAFSTDLLTPAQHQCLADMTVFEGGFTMEAAETVAEAPAHAVPDLLAALVDHSLLQSRPDPTGEVRFHLLQVVRDFVRHSLLPEASLDQLKRRHALYYAEFAPALAEGLDGEEQHIWIERGKAEYANVVAALTWLMDHNEATPAMTITGNLWTFWLHTGRMAEGRGLLERSLAIDSPADPGVRSAAENGLGVLGAVLGDSDTAIAAFERAASLKREADDQPGLVSVLNNIGNLYLQLGRYDRATRYFTDALDLLPSRDDDRRRASILVNLAIVARETGDLQRGIQLCREAFAISRANGNELAAAMALHNLGEYLHEASVPDEAVACLLEAARVFEEMEHLSMHISALNTLGDVAASQDDLLTSDARFRHALDLARGVDSPRQVATSLIGLARNSSTRGDHRAALPLAREALVNLESAGDPIQAILAVELIARLARAFGAIDLAVTLTAWAEHARQESGFSLAPSDIRLDGLKSLLDPATFETASSGGASMSLSEILGLVQVFTPPATSGERPSTSPPTPADARPDATRHTLTARELDVLRLIAEGKTNAEIGDALFISPLTAKTHVANVLAKIDLGSRAAAATWAARQGII